MANIFETIQNSDEFREEYFVAETQARVAELMTEKGVTRAELARKLDVTRARVTQIFSDEANNFTLRLMARAFLALGEEPLVISRREYDNIRLRAKGEERQLGKAGRRTSGAGEILTASMIADLLRSSESEAGEIEKPLRRNRGSREWAEAGPNVIPMRRAANG